MEPQEIIQCMKCRAIWEHEDDRCPECGNQNTEKFNPVSKIKELQTILNILKGAFSQYWLSEGCSCCEDTPSHEAAGEKIGELLNFDMLEDGSGYDFTIKN